MCSEKCPWPFVSKSLVCSYVCSRAFFRNWNNPRSSFWSLPLCGIKDRNLTLDGFHCTWWPLIWVQCTLFCVEKIAFGTCYSQTLIFHSLKECRTNWIKSSVVWPFLVESVSLNWLSVLYLNVSLVPEQLFHLLKLLVQTVLTRIDISSKKPTISSLHSFRLSQASPCQRLSVKKM